MEKLQCSSCFGELELDDQRSGVLFFKCKGCGLTYMKQLGQDQPLVIISTSIGSLAYTGGRPGGAK